MREWVTKEITVWETVWEQKFVAFPVPSGSSGLLAALTPQTWSNLLRTLGAGTALATLAATASFCDPSASDPCPTPTPDATGTTVAIYTRAPLTMTAQANQTAMAGGVPTPAPTGTLMPNWLQSSNDPNALNTHYINLKFLGEWLQKNQMWLEANGYPIDLTYWQNYYNQDILNYAIENEIPPFLLKGLILKESHFSLNPASPDAIGLAQITLIGFDQAFSHHPGSSHYIQLAYQYAFSSGQAGGLNFPPYDPTKYSSYQDYYLRALNDTQKAALRTEAQKIVDGMCHPADVIIGQCGDRDLSNPLLTEGTASVDLASQILSVNKSQLINAIGQDTWNTIPSSEQWKMIIASYNGGVGCVSNSFYSAQSTSASQILSWNQIKPHLEGNCIAPRDTEVYPDIVECYAAGSGDTPCQ